MQVSRDIVLNDEPGATMQLIRGTPFIDGIRGPQVEPNDLTLDRLTSLPNHLLTIKASIDLATPGQTNLLTAAQKLLVLGVVLRITAANTVTGPPQVSIGINPAADTLFAAENLVNLDAVGDMYTFWANLNTAMSVIPSAIVNLTVGTPATATELVATAYVIGTTL
jgi:hypothetical protein